MTANHRRQHDGVGRRLAPVVIVGDDVDVFDLAALRQLFRSPKFNVIDGLDDYCEDYTRFDPLGSIMTAELRHHAERLARKALEGDEAAAEGDAVAAADDGEAVAEATGANAPEAGGAVGRHDRPADESGADETATDHRSKTRDA